MEVQQNDQRQSYTIRYAQHPMYCLWHVTTGRLGFIVLIFIVFQWRRVSARSLRSCFMTVNPKLWLLTCTELHITPELVPMRQWFFFLGTDLLSECNWDLWSSQHNLINRPTAVLALFLIQTALCTEVNFKWHEWLRSYKQSYNS